MVYLSSCHVFIFIFLQSLFAPAFAIQHVNDLEIVNLDVGKELENESLPLHMGQRVYHVIGLRRSLWYEVKISYPASIPASFTIKLRKDTLDRHLGNRRLLNTEKLIFKANFDDMDLDPIEADIFVTVQPAGVVAQRGVQERDYILFNIVCDELSLGIPYKAWSVGMMAVLCLLAAFIIPYFLRHNLLPVEHAKASDTERKTT